MRLAMCRLVSTFSEMNVNKDGVVVEIGIKDNGVFGGRIWRDVSGKL